MATLFPMLRTEPARSPRLRLLVILGCLLAALALPLQAGPAMAQDDRLEPIGRDDWSGWLESHLAQEYDLLVTEPTGPGTPSWSRRLEMEYPA